MDSDMKWVALVFAFVIGIPMVGLALNDYQKNTCRVEAIKASMPADDIAKVCGK
jgi:hypothetical protein